MSFPLFLFTLRRTLGGMLLTGAGLFAFELFIVLFYGEVRPQQAFAPLVQLIPPAIRALLGAPGLSLLSPRGFLAFGCVHPLVLLLLGASAVTIGSRVIAAGVADGTLDLLLARPLRRRQILLGQVAVGPVAAVLLAGCMWLGQRAGTWISPLPETLPAGPFLSIAANGTAFYLALLGISVLASAMTSSRGQAVGVAVGWIALTFFLRLGAQMWAPLELPSRLSPFRYYVPLEIVENATFPLADVIVLLVMTLVSVLAAWLVFARRDIR